MQSETKKPSVEKSKKGMIVRSATGKIFALMDVEGESVHINFLNKMKVTMTKSTATALSEALKQL